nr:oxygen-regulated protein 1 [Solea senegalensis]
MSNTPIQDPAAQGLSSVPGSGWTLPSRPLQPISDSSTSKRVCFYKSGDYKFSGHRMVISARTFKSFDALLDALSKKVPLPFGVRTITTPRGTHLVKGLDDLQDGGAYVCSDQRRVKPLNLNEVNRQQIRWNTTRPLSARRQRRLPLSQSGRRNVLVTSANRSTKVNRRVAVRTPKRFMVIKNKDPTVKCTIVLHRRTAPTFDALLDYLSEILQFPVLKLFSTDGRRVDGLAALILCSGVVVAAGSEPFRLGNYGFHRTSQMAQVMHTETMETSMLQPRASNENNKSFSSRKGIRNFSLSSEQYIVNQINKSQNGGMNSPLHRCNGSFETEVNQHHTSVETCLTGRVENEHHNCILPHEDDIEKSFRVNQDGSMTVEMKVHLTIKEEEMLHWTTTLSRASLSKRTVHASVSESGNSSPASNSAVAKTSSRISDDVTKEENHPAGSGKGVCFNGEQVYGDNTSKALRKVKSSIKRAPTPGPRRVRKASVGSVKKTESGVKERSLGHYSYMERTADGETTEGYCVVRHSSSSSSSRSNRPIPNPRKMAPAGATNKGFHSSVRSSGAAEVLQIENNGMEVTETVMCIYESQGCYENYFANQECSTDDVPLHGPITAPDSEPSSETRPHSSSNDIDFSRQPSTADSLQRLKGEMLSLSSEPIYSTREITNNLCTMNDNETPTATNSQMEGTVQKAKTPQSGKNKKVTKHARNDRHATSKNSKRPSTDKLNNNVSVGKKSLSSSESAKSGQQSKGEKKIEKSQSKKSIKDEKTPKKDSALLGKAEKVKSTLSKRQSTDKYNGHNVNTPTGRPQMKKNISDILQPRRSFGLTGNKTVSKPKSVTLSPKKPSEFNESVSMPSLNPTPSEIHQYVENWLENVSQDHVPYTEAVPGESVPQSKVVFQVGGDSESDEKNESQIGLAEHYPLSGVTVQKSVPLQREGPETSNHEKPNSLPDFSTQVASVFGSSFKAFMSFLSVMILRDNLKESVLEDGNQSRSSSEATLMTQSLLKISAIEDKEQQNSCLIELQSRASSHFTKCWKDFQILRERLEVSESKFALDIVSDEGAIFEDQHRSIDELMEELNMPKDLRAEMYSTIQEAKSFYLVQESTLVETERNQTDSVLSADGAKSAEPGDASVENITEDIQETGPGEKDLKVSQTKKHVTLDVTQHESEADEDEDQMEEVKEQGEGEQAGEDGNKETNEGEELENIEREREEEEGTVEANDEAQNDSEAEKGSDEECVGKMKGGTEEEMTDEEGEELEEGEKGVVEETDERESAKETQEGEEGTNGGGGKTDEDGIWEEGTNDETEDETDKLVDKTYKKVIEEQEIEKNEEKEEEVVEVNQMTDEEEELENNDNVEEKEEVDAITEDEEEAEKEELEHSFGEEDDEEEDMDVVTEQGNEERDQMEQDSEENDEEEEEAGDAEVENTRVVKDEEEEENTKGLKEIEHCSEEQFEAKEVEKLETEEDMKVVQKLAEEEREDDDENQTEKQQSFFESKDKRNLPGDEDNFDDDDEDCKNLLEEASYLQQNSSDHENAHTEHNSESPAQISSEGQCEHAKHSGTDNEFETDDEERNLSLVHPVEISQELLDFVNLALQTSSLIFTYDAWGNIRLEPDNARVVPTQKLIIPISRNDCLYGSKCLPSPSTSDLSDYRPETSESGGYKTQDSVDIVTDSGEEASTRQFSVNRDENCRETNGERATSKLSLGSDAECLQSSMLKSAQCLSSSDSGTKASKEDLSYFSGETSVKADIEDVPEATQCCSFTSEKDTTDGVLIDRGRWLLKENHLMRRSPPFSQGMYDDVDSTSMDTGQDSPSHCETKQNPTVAISSSELEEMSKPQTPKCNYFNMPHGSDSDPFLDDSSVHSGKKQTLSVKGRDFRVSPTIDTTKTWPNKRGSLSSFASVEFKMPDGKVHPEGESSAAAQQRQTSSGGSHVLQAQDSVDTLHVRCGQYCPIL